MKKPFFFIFYPTAKGEKEKKTWFSSFLFSGSPLSILNSVTHYCKSGGLIETLSLLLSTSLNTYT